MGLGMTYDELVKKRDLAEHSRFVEGAAISATKSISLDNLVSIAWVPA